jgi:glycosyltransferase involved in cell wall biosynthesis
MTASTPEKKISIVIPVHNAGEYFRLCLESISASEMPPCEIIVVADGDSDGSWNIAGEFGAKLLRIPHSQGPARARNLGAQEAVGDILLFIDSDVTIPENALSQVAAAFRNDPGLAALFGSYDDEPYAGNFLSQYKNLFHNYVHQMANEDASTFWCGCGAVKRTIFQGLGGFNDNYRKPSIEDIEFGYRLKRKGYRIRLVKELKVKHLKRWDIFSLLRADFLYRALPWTTLILREGKLLNDLNLKISSRISAACVYLLLISLSASFKFPWLLAPAGVCIVALLALNWGLYRFFREKRGLLFAVKALPWNWLYFFYSGLAFSIGFIRFRFGKPSL